MPKNEMDVWNLTIDKGKAHATAKKKYATATANLTIAFQSEASLGIVFNAKTVE
jgi:hypothetical protein